MIILRKETSTNKKVLILYFKSVEIFERNTKKKLVDKK